MTTQVSYPLYSSVPAGAFVAYHARYSRRIQPVIIAPGFPTFLACVAFPFVRPDGVPGRTAALVAIGGLVALAATIALAIPSHLRLQREGFGLRAYRRLRAADGIRTLGCVLSAVLLVWSVFGIFGPR